jgi:WD40 repeat protein
VAYRPDGRRLVSGSNDNTVRQWDAETGQQIGAPLTGHTDIVTSVAYRPDGRRLVSGSEDYTLRQWDAETGEQIGAPLTGHTDGVRSVAYRPDGRLVSGSEDATLRQWDAETGKQIGAPLTGHTESVSSVAYRSDGRRLVSGSYDNTVRQWDAETGKQIGAPLTGHTDAVECVAYRPDGRRLVSGSRDNTLRQWDAETGEQIGEPLVGHTGRVYSVAYHPDGRRLVSGSYDDTLRQWDTATGVQIGAPLIGHTELVLSVAYRPDGRRLVSGSWDNTLRQWDAETGTQIGASLTGHTESVSSVAYRSDGRCIVSGSSDKTVRLWDAQSHQCLAMLQWHQTVNSVAFCAEPISAPTIAESKAVATRGTAAIQAAEYHLAIGDTAGTISFWAVSVAHPEAGFRLRAMPKHSGMPLLANGANLKDCQMSAMSKRLLEQHGADVSQVIVVHEADHSIHNKADTKLTRDSKVEAKVIATSSAVSTVQPVTPLVTRKEPTSIPKMVVTAPQTLPPKVEAKVTITTAVMSTSSSSQTTASPAKTGFFAKLLGRKSVTTASHPSVSASQTHSSGPSSPQSPADAKAQSLLKELYALLDEVYPANDSSVAKQRSDYLAKLKPYQERRATLTPGDRGKLRQLQSELETIQAAACQPPEVGMG